VAHSRFGGRTVATAALFLTSLALLSPANAVADHPARESGRGHVDWAGPAAPATTRPDPSFGPAQRRSELKHQQRLAETTADRLGLGPREALVVKDVLRDTDGTEHVRYDRTYAGLPVIGGDMVVEKATSGALQATRATDMRIAVASTRARLAGDDVKSRAATRNDLRAGPAAPVKVVFAARHRPVLAWQTTVIGTSKDGTPIRDLVYTDASTGRQLARLPQIMDVHGRGRSLYSGTVGLDTVHSGSTYQLIDNTRGGHRTYNKQHKCCTSRGVLFTDRDNVWGNGKTTSAQSAAVDAAYGAAHTWDFYLDQFGRHGIADDGRAAYSRVHFRKSYDNAFWDDACFCMTYGDGNSHVRPLVALDVVGHEMSHGVTAATAALDYVGDSGGLNESTSDVMGTMVEFSAHNATDKGDYLLGEKIDKRGFTRRMDNPKADGHSVNCWTPSVGSLDPHFSSGVGNHAFYLLAEGTGTKVIGGRQHSSTTCSGTPLSGIGRTKAAAIWYRALTNYWTSTTTYPQAADGQVRAAKELFGAGSAPCLAVVQAWKGVRVNTTESCADGASSSANLVQNPGFESGASSWTTVSASGDDIIVNKNDVAPVPAHRGSWFAYLNDHGQTATDTLRQDVAIPGTATTATLTFFLNVGTDETTTTGKRDTLKVQVGPSGGTLSTRATYSNLDGGRGYVACSVDLSADVGQTVTLRFLGHEDNARATGFLVDDVSLTTD
jgi:Zn-dependent metalloprotease